MLLNIFVIFALSLNDISIIALSRTITIIVIQLMNTIYEIHLCNEHYFCTNINTLMNNINEIQTCLITYVHSS